MLLTTVRVAALEKDNDRLVDEASDAVSDIDTAAVAEYEGVDDGRDSPVSLQYTNRVHRMCVALPAGQYEPIGHISGASTGDGQYRPAGHNVGAARPDEVQNVPGVEQLTGDDEYQGQYEPIGHSDCEKEPLGQ